LVALPQLRLISRDNYCDRKLALFGIPNQFLNIGFGDAGLVLVVHDHVGLKGVSSRIAKGHQVIAVARQFLANPNTPPRACLFRKIQFFFLADASHLGHLGFKLLIPLAKNLDLLEIVLYSTVEVIRLC
jgi:hypothetical protein